MLITEKRYYIFGAKSIAVGAGRALRTLYPDREFCGYIVSDMSGNPDTIDGYMVRPLSKVIGDTDAGFVVATPQIVHGEIESILSDAGFHNIYLLNSQSESDLMERYYRRISLFGSLHDLSADNGGEPAVASVFAARFFADKEMSNPPVFPEYVKSIELGCEVAKERGISVSDDADFFDDRGDNISGKNPNYCEMTAYYWIWKKALDLCDDYVGVYHYRRMLDISDEDLMRIRSNDIDVVLPYPMLHLPDAREHHTRYIPDADWDTMLEVLEDMYPEYRKAYDEIFSKPYFYNYNMMVAKKRVFADYCAWLFPLLFEIGRRSTPRENERADRYLAYMSESLETLYFMANLGDLRIVHTGRLLFV